MTTKDTLTPVVGQNALPTPLGCAVWQFSAMKWRTDGLLLTL